ncbi:MAG: hypothetical protein DMD43_05560 [Gemmatimonadetes bacterium]|nr:MAG: hypothetical protein DMD43_05560 [Gemmatimonadota bacterium]
MIWTLAVVGVVLTVFGATAHAALVTWSRGLLAEVVARRLRGGQDSLAWLAPLERNLSAASVTTTLGIAPARASPSSACCSSSWRSRSCC